MAESFVALPPDSTGKRQRTLTYDPGTGPVHQEVVSLAAVDGTVIDPLRRGEALPAGTNQLGHVIVDPGSYVSDTFAAKIGQGKARIGGKTITTTVVAPNAYFTVQNPAGNTRVVYVVGFDVYASATSTVAYATGFAPVNPSIGTLFNPNQAVTAPSSAVVYAGGTPYTGGTVQPLASRVVANAPLKISLLSVLPPGTVLGIQVIGAAAGSDIAANVFLYEE